MLCVSGVRKLLLFFLLLFFLSSAIGFAHKVNIFAWVESDTIHTESYFPDGTTVKSGEIEVIDSTGAIVHQGIIDENGEYSFRIPKHDNLTIVLDTFMGHRATFEISADELEGYNIEGYYQKESSEKGSHNKGSNKKGNHGGSNGGSNEADKSFYKIGANNNSAHQNIDLDEIRSVVRDEISQQLKPIVRDVAELKAKRRISAQEIFAGIGYLLGLMGIVMYFKSKGKK